MKAFVMAVAFVVTAGSMAPAFAQAPLSVPYLPQTEALCGGAAAAMVMRFWGARGVYADAFAPLVDKAANGIHTSALSADLQSRGWRTDAGGGSLQRLAAEIGRGRPVIALIEDRPGRFHYVVVVSAPAGGPIVVHDPARAPSRAMNVEEFDRKWQRSDRWMMLLLPGSDLPHADVRPEPDTRESAAMSACQPRIDAAVHLVETGDRNGARRTLESAAAECRDDAAVFRELAGLDVLEQRWDEAAAHARTAVDKNPHDAYAWRLLATAEYLGHDDLGALSAWNHIGEPKVDILDVRGLERTRYLVVANAIGIAPRELLTPGALRVAQRRVCDIPALSTARVSFHPLERGAAQVDASVVERARAPLSYPSWIGIGIGAAANREVRTSIVNISGGGDAVDVMWRWWEHRPAVGVTYAAPGPGGIWKLEASRETQTFGATPFEETRTRVGGELSNWLDQRTRVSAGLFVDRWRRIGRTAAVSGRAQWWPLLDRLSFEAGAAGWRGSGARFGAADVRARLRSKASSVGTVFLAEAGYQAATSSAPASLWPGADTGHARDVLLRAHPLLDDGVIREGIFGRRIGFASVEAQHWLRPVAKNLLRIAPAVFLDSARATRGFAFSDRRVHYDAGAGIRIALPGTGVLRVDVAHGLRDGRTAISVGWQR